MTTHYKLWIEVEAIDEDRDHYETIPLHCGAITTMESMQEAIDLAEDIKISREPSRKICPVKSSRSIGR